VRALDDGVVRVRFLPLQEVLRQGRVVHVPPAVLVPGLQGKRHDVFRVPQVQGGVFVRFVHEGREGVRLPVLRRKGREVRRLPDLRESRMLVHRVCQAGSIGLAREAGGMMPMGLMRGILSPRTPTGENPCA